VHCWWLAAQAALLPGQSRCCSVARGSPLPTRRLSAAGGSRPAERRVRSFPVLFDAAAQGDGAAAAAEGDAWAGVQGGPPSLVSGGASDSEWEEMGEEEVAAQAPAEAAARERRLREAQDGAVEDCRLSEGEEDSDEGPPPLRSDPGSEESEGEQPPARRRPTAAAAPHAPPPLLPLGDMLLLGGVAAGELARRFLLVLGAPAAPGAAGAGARGQAAAVAEAVERLRGLTEVPTAEGAAREAVVVSAAGVGMQAGWGVVLTPIPRVGMRAKLLGGPRLTPPSLSLRHPCALAGRPAPAGGAHEPRERRRWGADARDAVPGLRWGPGAARRLPVPQAACMLQRSARGCAHRSRSGYVLSMPLLCAPVRHCPWFLLTSASWPPPAGAEHRNLFLTRAQPGYLRITGERAPCRAAPPQRPGGGWRPGSNARLPCSLRAGPCLLALT
jgi:hypothetical protein